ncbi:binuclear zinc transcription factor, partial [Colletotrichum tofieldiae]
MPPAQSLSAQPSAPRTPDGRDGEAGNPEVDSRWSCFQCRSRKVKCDRVKPQCGRCTRLKDTCIFPESRQKPQGKTLPDNLEDRLARLERVMAASHNDTGMQLDNSISGVQSVQSELYDDSMAWHPDEGGLSTLSSIISAQNIPEDLPNDINYHDQTEQILPTPLLEN